MVREHSSEFDTKCHLGTCKTHPPVTDFERGEILCGRCGLVLVQSVPDPTTEDRAFSQGEYMEWTRMGPAGSLTMHDRGLSTVIGRNVDATGGAISTAARETFSRLRIWDKRSRSRAVSSLGRAMTALSAMTAKLAIPDPVAEGAAYTYRKVVLAKLTRGRSTLSLVAASLYVACRKSSTPRSLNDIADAANVEKRTLSRDLRTIIRKLNLSLNQYDTSAFVVKLANNLNMREKVKRDALTILQKSRQAGITAGKHPVAQAAASLYMSCILNGECLSQKRFSTTVGVSDVTIRNRIEQIKRVLEPN